MKKTLILWTTFLLIGASGLMAQIQVSASFQPAVVRQGEPSLYRVDFSSDSGSTSFYNSAPPKIPRVEGLQFQYIGPSHETRFINGKGSTRTSHLFRAFSSEPGKYEVPAFSIQNGSSKAEIPAATLEVLDAATAQAEAGDAESRTAWLELKLPRETLYVGETTPIGIRLFLNSQQIRDASLRAEHPEKVGDAFSIGEFSDMSQNRVALNGLPVTVVDWNVLLTPLKTGPQPLIFELPLAVVSRNSTRPNDPFGSFFGGNSPFSQMFGREGITAYSKDQEVEILPLPTANRPDDFTGGIGSFQLEETQISSTEVQVGEPFLFSIQVSGEGNFERLEAPVLQASDKKWKDYSPETSFTPRDRLSYAGVKTFTFTLVPRDEGITTTPTFSFSFFDPETAEYKTVEVPPTSLTVNPAPPGSLPPKQKAQDANPVEARRGPDLLPLQTQWTSGGLTSVRSPFRGLFFWIVQAVVFVLLIVGFLLLRHRARLQDDPDYARRNRAKRASRRFLKEANDHAAAGSVEAFVHSACRAIQESVGPFQSGEPESLTEKDVIAILKNRESAESILEEVHHFFAAEESVQYGGQKAAQADLNSEKNRLRELLAQIHARKKSRAGGIPPMVALLVTLSLLALSAPDLSAQEEDNTTVPETATVSEEIPPVTEASQARTVFDDAVENYADGNFAMAAAQFGSLLPNFSSSQTHYNLANALYRIREYPQSILHYEKAFVLDPTNPDIRANLKLAREAASVDIPEDPPLAVIGHRLSWCAWSWLLALGFWGVVGTLLLSRPARLSNLWRNALGLFFGLILIAAGLAQVTWFSTANEAVVLTEDAPLRIAPTASSPLESRLIAGSDVDAKETYGDFQRVQLEDGTEGWILKTSIERVRPE